MDESSESSGLSNGIDSTLVQSKFQIKEFGDQDKIRMDLKIENVSPETNGQDWIENTVLNKFDQISNSDHPPTDTRSMDSRSTDELTFKSFDDRSTDEGSERQHDKPNEDDESSNYVSLTNSNREIKTSDQQFKKPESNPNLQLEQLAGQAKSTEDQQMAQDNSTENQQLVQDNSTENRQLHNAWNGQIDKSNSDSRSDQQNDQQFKQSDSSIDLQLDQLAERDKLAQEQQSMEFVELFGNSDLLKRILKRGDSSILKPERTCEVLINIEVRNNETNELIYSESKQNLTVFVGDFDLIHGVDMALVTMHKGEIAEILVQPQLAYGPTGKEPDIPSNCVLLCNVELLNIIRPQDMMCESYDRLKHYFKLSICKKERGNFYFKRQEFETALLCYVKSGDLLEFLGQEMVNRHHFLTQTQSKAADELRKKEISDELSSINKLSVEYMRIKLDVFNNLSAVYIKKKSYNSALDAVENALRIESNDLKALYRKSTILKHKGCIEEAIASLKDALRLDPKNKTFIGELNKLKVKLNDEIKGERELYAKMLQLKDQSKIEDEKINSDRQFHYLAIAGLVVSGVLSGYILYRKYAKS